MSNDKKSAQNQPDLSREDLQAQLAEAQAHIAAQQAVIDKAKGGVIAVPIQGSFNAKWKTPKGQQSRKVEFKDGHVKVRLKDGKIVSTAALLKLANGKMLTEDELKASPPLSRIDKEGAAEWLTHLAKINYGYLK